VTNAGPEPGLDVAVTDTGPEPERDSGLDAAVTDTEPETDESEESGRRRRGLVWFGVGGVVVAAAGVGVGLWATNTSSEAPAKTGPEATATVERGTISATQSWDGTLDFGAPTTVVSAGGGTVTRLADQGEAVGRGDVLFRVNERPATLLLGAVPMFRDLGPGDSGADVEQLEANLAELGYRGLTGDGEYTSSIADAVEAWQNDIGTEPTGRLGRGDVVFVPQGGQIDALRSEVGDVVGPGTPILDITGTDQVVSLEVEVDDKDRFEIDSEVAILLPGGDEVAGTVAATAVVEVDPQGPEGGAGEADTESILQVEIAVDEQAPDELVGAPVEVVADIDERTDVLLVPVNALLALAEGGFGLEVVADDGSTSLVPVETGLFADGKVEVEAHSAEVAEGTVVGTAGR